MSRILIIFFTLMISFVSYGQVKEYKSKEQKKYYKKFDYKTFKPLSKKVILSYENEFFKFTDLVKYSPFSDTLRYTPYQDSVFAMMFNPANVDSMIIPEPAFIGEIERRQILKYEKKGQIEAFIYESSKFEDQNFGESGIWIAFSSDKGNSWKYLYTGMVQKQPLYVKWYSDIPLIKSEGVLQMETCLLRQLTPFTHPGPVPTYEVIKDGLKITFDLETLQRDSDHDGLTDIVETKLYTNLNSNDTDGDGISDIIDLNPRYAKPRTENTVIFESALNEETNMFDTTGIIKYPMEIPKINRVTDTTETVLMVTDSQDIQSIQPLSTRVIILSEKEYKKKKGLYRTELNKMSISPLFKVDGEIDTYIFIRSINSWGEKYVVKKSKEGWKIMVISSWIS